MKPQISIERALTDRNLLGAALGPIETWRSWLVTLKGAFAEAMSEEELAIFAQLSGGRAAPARRVRELWAGPIGRRGGKSPRGCCDRDLCCHPGRPQCASGSR